MSKKLEETICKHNQTGFCKFENNCRNRHVYEICSEDNNCKTKGCPKRHPKLGRNILRDESYRFGKTCAYKHKIENKQETKEIIAIHNKEIDALKN